MPRVIYLGFSGLPVQSELTLTAMQQATEQGGSLTLETLTATQRETLSHWLANENQPHVILVWPRPGAYIASGLAGNEPVERVLQKWKNLSNQVLMLFRRHRRQLTLLGVAPGEAIELSGELPIEILNEVELIDSILQNLSQAAPFYRLAAAQLIADDSNLQEALAYINASSYTCGAAIDQTIETVRLALQDFDKCNEAESQVKMLLQERNNTREENELLLTQLHDVQLTLEATEQKVSEWQTKVQWLEDTATTKQQVKTLAEQQDNTLEENELLRIQLHTVQEALEEAYVGRQPDLSIPAFDQQELLHRYKCMVVWLRAIAHRHITATYRDSRRYKKMLPKQTALLKQSGLFDTQWYCKQYKDVAEANMNPVEHFIKFGAIEGRNPSPNFNTEFYLMNNSDVAASGQNPLLHYIRDGIKEQRMTQEVQ